MDQVFDALKKYYEGYDEQQRFSSKHGCIEFLTTVHYVEKYLKPGMKLLEIGAGTGRYTHYFAQKGYEVDAVELMPCNIEAFRKLTKPGEPVRIMQGNAVDLPIRENERYDLVLMLGPMYHLFDRDDQLKALYEALRMTKKGGLLFTAYCCADAAIVQAGFMRGRVQQLIAAGMLDPITFKTHSDPKDVFELYLKEDIDSLMANFDAERLHYVGTDMAAHYIRETIDGMDDETFDLYMKYHLSICERPDMVGVSNHSLDVVRKGRNSV